MQDVDGIRDQMYINTDGGGGGGGDDETLATVEECRPILNMS
jgi:hypothetical protein